MGPAVLRTDSAGEFLTPERCYIAEWLNSPDDPALSVARARVTAGVTTAWHVLEGIAERYVVVAGRGRVEVGDSLAEDVAAGDVVVIPAGVRQRISNPGPDDLVFLALCTPRFVASAYRDLER